MRYLALLTVFVGLISSAIAAEMLELSGRVIDAQTGDPLPGIQLVAAGQPNPPTTNTDAEGKFGFSLPAGGPAYINFQHAAADYLIDERSMGPGAYYNVQKLTSAKTDITLRIRLRKLSPMTGEVVDADGKPVAGASVMLDSRLSPVVTDANGTFLCPKAPNDRSGVAFAFAGDAGGQAPFAANQDKITIRVLPRQPQEVLLTTEDGAPVADASLQISPAIGFGPRRPFAAEFTKTDAEGKCRPALVPGMPYSFTWPPGPNGAFAAGSAVRTIQPGSQEPLTITIPQYKQALTLHFTDSAGSPLPDVQLQFPGSWNMVSPELRNQFNQMKSDAQGTVQIKGLAKGTLHFMTHMPRGNYRQARFAVPTDAGEATFTVTTQDEPAAYHVRVVDSAGQPVPDAPISVFIRSRGQVEQEDYNADENGVAAITIPGQNVQAAFLCDDADRGWGAVAVSTYQDGAFDLPLRVPGAPLQVQLLDAQKKPVAGAQVKISSLRSADATNNPFGDHQQMPTFLDEELLTFYGLMQTTDADGRANFARVPAGLPGSIQIASAAFGNQHKQLPADGPHVITLLKLASIRGTLSLPDGGNLDRSGAHLMLQGSDGGGTGAGLRPDGSFEFRDLQPGEYTLRLYAQSAETQKFRLPRTQIKLAPGEQRTLDLELQPGIPVRGKFDFKVDGRRPKLLLSGEDMGPSQPIQVRDDGSFELWVGEPGSYQLMYEFEPNSYRPLPEPIDIKDRNPVEGVEIKAP